MTSKEYVYRVSDSAGNYIGVWPDVVSDPSWSQQINTPGTTMVVRLARSANNTIEKRDNLVTSGGDQFVTDDGDPYFTVSETPNTIGADTDVDLNYQVEVYVQYGSYDDLVVDPTLDNYARSVDTEILPIGSTPIPVDLADDDYIVSTGAPLGRRVFSGIILDYEANYGDEEYVEVTLSSNGMELSNEIIQDGSSDTTVTFSGVSPEAIFKNILDTNPGVMGYSAASLAPTGLSVNQQYVLNTKLEGLTSAYGQTDNGWYWYGNIADNLVYLQPKNTVADHVFVMGQHINTIQIKRSLESLKNDIYFVGGNPGSGVLYKKFTSPSSITNWRKGVDRITDTRFLDGASMSRYASKVMSRYADPIYTCSLMILSEVYDIETIELGQMVGFQNAGNFIDSLLLQIVQIDYTPHLITLQLGDLLDRIQDSIIQTAESLQNSQYSNLPTIPT